MSQPNADLEFVRLEQENQVLRQALLEAQEKCRHLEAMNIHIATNAYVTTTDTCSNCGAKLTNAETARLNWQGEAARLSKELAQAQAACDEWESKYLELTFKSTDEAKRLEAQCAAMRRWISTIKHSTENNQPIPWLGMIERAEQALSTTAGQSLLERLERAEIACGMLTRLEREHNELRAAWENETGRPWTTKEDE